MSLKIYTDTLDCCPSLNTKFKYYLVIGRKFSCEKLNKK